MGMAAAPAAGTAFGTSALAASAPVYASMAAAPIASVGASMMMNPAIISPGAGFFGSLGTVLQRPLFSTNLLGDIGLKEIGYGLSTGMSMFQTYRQGQMTKSMMNIEDMQLRADLARKELNYELDALKRLRAVKALNANIVASRFSGGVYGLDGSAKLLESINLQRYGEDAKMALFNIENDIINGNAQSEIYKKTGDQAVFGANLNAAAKLGEAVYMYDRLGFPGRTTE